MLKVDVCDVCARTFVTFLKVCPESGGVSHEAEFRCVRKTWLFFLRGMKSNFLQRQMDKKLKDP